MDYDNCSGDLTDDNRAKVSDLLCQRVYSGGDEDAGKRKSPLRLQEEWFAEQDRIRDAIGLDDTPFPVVGCSAVGARRGRDRLAVAAHEEEPTVPAPHRAHRRLR
ncbi:hypothetical protein PAHAL_9G009500 [Panicum hallii]|uniref:Uncharacterized protein n=1 Tax=Panicum hallii TaxID=206008 RepID=A0A2T8HZM6_9POAL|nr:hypothetical protein PAHAL_9G009500 [Panicum hallii]